MGNTVKQEAALDAPHDEIAINYISTGESMNRAMAIVDINFAKKIVWIRSEERRVGKECS